MNKEDIEEIISDTFFLLWKNQNRIDKNLKAYLARIARNCTYKKIKERKIDIEYDDQLYYQDYSFQSIIIKEAFNQLTDEEQELFLLYYYYGLKVKEISKRKNLKSSYVKVKLHRIRKKLKESING